MRTHRTARFAVLVLVAGCAFVAPFGVDAQDSRARRVAGAGAVASDEPIELSTDVVNVLFSASDAKNRFVGDVKEGEVVITENGQPQQVFAFRREDSLPLEVVLLVDVSSSQEFTFDDEKRAASAFLQRVLRPKKDSAAVMKFGDDLYHVQGMTDRLVHISEAFNRMTWESRPTVGGPRHGSTALYDAIATTIDEVFPKDKAVTDPANVTRRAIVVLTDGADTSSERSLKQAIDEAIRAGVIVYAVGIGDRYRSTAVQRATLDVLANQTGGRAYVPESYEDLAAAFKQVEDELRSQYLIAYEPSRVNRDGSFREITITLPSRPDVKIFHRKGYFAPKPTDAPPPKAGAQGKP
jgi:Ca-activated chloride channel family protein